MAFFKIHFTCFEMHMDRPDKSENIFGIWYQLSKHLTIWKGQMHFCIFLQSTHQVDMKNIVECEKDFFAYFNALETSGGVHS